ncbi:hypothetical protein CPC698_1352B, partial [Chlamydia psittaci C6/98]
NRF